MAWARLGSAPRASTRFISSDGGARFTLSLEFSGMYSARTTPVGKLSSSCAGYLSG